jgi:WD40 repeat protein
VGCGDRQRRDAAYRTQSGTNLLASASADKTLRFWDTTTNKQVSSIGFWALSMAVSPDGKTLAAGSIDGKVRLWDVPGSKKVKE